MIEKVRATIEDIDALGAMETKYFPSPWTKAQFEEEMKNNPFSRIFLLKDEKEKYSFNCNISWHNYCFMRSYYRIGCAKCKRKVRGKQKSRRCN